MVARGSFVVFGGGSGGGGGEAIVAVPGNSAQIVARAADTDVTVTALDADHVSVALPASTGIENFLDLMNQLIYVFGAPGEDEIGWITVSAKGILGMADSSDPGPNPNYVPVTGTITFVPEITGVVRLLTTGRFFAVAPVTCTFDSDGELSYDGGKTVRLISPLWSELANKAWKWTATVSPGFGQSWDAFVVQFTGAPGTTVNLASLLP